jgi:SAM-dependent methyltransferase
MTGKRDWQGAVGRSWAAEQARTDRSFAGLTPHLLAAIAALPGECVVDIGCGAGELSLAVAAARPQASILGIDISEDLVAAASARGQGQANARFELADASIWTPASGAPDLYVSRHGVMFFPDPPAAFTNLTHIAAPDARIVFSCFRSPAENGWASEIASLLPPAEPAPSQPFAPGPFAFADPDHVRRCMAGWRDFTFAPVDFEYVAGAGSDPVADALAYFRRIGPAAAAARDLPEGERELFLERLEALLRSRLSGNQIVFPAAAWLITAVIDR